MIKTYDTYKDSGIAWIGNIPSNWTVCKTKQCFTLYSGATPKTDNKSFWDGNIPWITPADYKTENKTINNGRRFLTQKGVESCGTTIVPENSIIFSKRAPIGLVAINKQPVCTNQGCISCVPKEVSSLFYYYAMSTFTNAYELYGSGTTFKEISASSFANFKLPYPILSEQLKIASFLDKKCGEIDELLAVQEQMINELQAYKQSIITKAVTKGLNPNVLMEDSGIEWIGEIPNGWTICRFKNVAKVKANLVHPDNYLDMQQIAPDCIEKGSGKILKSRTVKEANVISDNHLFYKGQILYSKIRPTLNKVIIAPYDGLCCADMYPIETTLENKFCLYQMLSSFFYEQVGVVVQDRVKMPKINKEELDQITILVPPINEQKEIAAYLDEKTAQIDSLIALKQEKIKELKDYKKSIIYEYVTGKKKV